MHFLRHSFAKRRIRFLREAYRLSYALPHGTTLCVRFGNIPHVKKCICLLCATVKAAWIPLNFLLSSRAQPRGKSMVSCGTAYFCLRMSKRLKRKKDGNQGHSLSITEIWLPAGTSKEMPPERERPAYCGGREVKPKWNKNHLHIHFSSVARHSFTQYVSMHGLSN